MTQPNPALYELQRVVGQNYMAILQEINAIGVNGYLELIDAATEDELRALATAADTIYNQIQKFKASRGAPGG